MVDSNSLEEVDCFDVLIKPVRHSQLTQWLSDYDNYVFCSWGNYDRNHLESDSSYHNVQNPISVMHVNLKKEYAKRMKVKRMGMQRALELINEPLMGSSYRGIDDARNIRKLLPYCMS